MFHAFFSSKPKGTFNDETVKRSLILAVTTSCMRRSRKQSAIIFAGTLIAFCIQRWWRSSRRTKPQRDTDEQPRGDGPLILFGWKPAPPRRVSCQNVSDQFRADVAAILDGDPLWDDKVYPNARERRYVDQAQVAAILDGNPLMDNNTNELGKREDSRDTLQLEPQ